MQSVHRRLLFVPHRHILQLLTSEGTLRIHWSQRAGFLLLVVLVACAHADSEKTPVRVDVEHGLEPCFTTSPGVTVVRGGAHFNYGNGELWTSVWPKGTVSFRAGGLGFVNPDGSLSMKWPWYLERSVRGKLKIQGRRLDAPSERSVSGNHTPVLGDSGFHAGILTFPSEGCWEVTGKAATLASRL